MKVILIHEAWYPIKPGSPISICLSTGAHLVKDRNGTLWHVREPNGPVHLCSDAYVVLPQQYESLIDNEKHKAKIARKQGRRQRLIEEMKKPETSAESRDKIKRTISAITRDIEAAKNRKIMS